jgi:hypothetical protein
MAKQYRPNLPFSVPLVLLKPIISNVAGVRAKTVPDIKDGILFFGTFKTYGGTERTVDGLLSIEDTADVETWYRPDITSDCIIALADTGTQYRIINEPENINRQNQFLKFKVQRLKGGV